MTMDRYDNYPTLHDDLTASEQAEWLGAVLAGAGALGSLFGKGAKSSAEGRRTDAQIQAQMAGQNNAAQLNAARFNLDAPGQLGRRMLGAGSLLNFQPTQFSDPRMPKMSGGGAAGFAQSLQDPATRQALLQMLRGSGQSIQSGSYRINPQMAQMQKAGWLEKIGGAAGLIGGLAGGLKDLGVGASKSFSNPVTATAGMPRLPGGGLPGTALPGELGSQGWQLAGRSLPLNYLG